MSLSDITALVLTYNEEANIGRTLSRLASLRRVVVLDSGSTDGTREIVARHRNAILVPRQFDTFADQCNFGLSLPDIDTEWVLVLDADYVLTEGLVAELTTLTLPDDIAGFRARFRYCIHGQVIRSGVYPPVTILFRRSRARFVNDGHGHRVAIDGRVEPLSGFVEHDDRKPLSRWLDSQKTYARQEADKLESAHRADLRWQDRIRSIVGLAAPLMFVHVLVLRGGLLDGWFGVHYAFQRAYAEWLLSFELLDRRLRRARDSRGRR